MARGWYVIHTRTGYEDRVNKLIQQKMDTEFYNKVFSVLIPTENVIQVKQNKKEVRKRKFFPGYILIDVDLNSETYWGIKSIQGVSGFLGDPHPVPLKENEASEILDLASSSRNEKPKPAVQFERGENIRIIEGPFKHFMGVVDQVNEEKSKLKVIVTVFDRPTPVELDFLQVEKV